MDAASLRVMFTAGGDGTVTRAIDTVNRKLDTVDNHAKRAGSALDSVFKVAGGVLLAQGVARLGDMASGILSMHSNAEQAKVSLEAVTGSAERAGEVYNRVLTMAKETPFETKELVDSALQLEALGLKTEDWITTIGDTAAATGKSIDQVTQAATDATFGEYERLKELGIQARTEGDKLVLTYLKNGKQITETVDKNNKEIIADTIQGIWNDRYAGAMAKQARTFAGQWSTLTDNISMGIMGATDGIFGALTDVLDFANQVFADGFVDAVRNIAGPLEGLADIVATLFEAFDSGEGVSDLMNVLFGPGSPMAGAPELIKDVTHELLMIADALGDIRAGGFDGLLGELGNIAESVGEIAIIATVTITEWVIDSAVDLYFALKNKVAEWVGLGGNADGTNATAGMTGGISLGTLAVTIADLAIGSIAGWAADAIPTVQAWLDTNKLSGFTQIVDVESFLPALENAERGDYEAAILAYLTADPIEITPDLVLDINAAIGNWISGGDGGGGGTSIDWSQIADWMQASLRVANPFAIVADDIATLLGTEFGEAFDSLFGGGGAEFGPGTGALNRTGHDIFQGWADAIIQEFKDLPGDIAEGVGTLSLDVIPQPTLPSWLSTNWDWILDPIETLTGYVNDLLGLIGQAISAKTSADAAMGVNPLMPFGMGGDAPRMSPNRQVGEGIIDVNPVVSLVPEFDVSGVAAAAETALANVTALGDKTFTATLDADSGPFAVKYTEAFGWGDTLAATTWTGTLDLDNGPAAVAYTEAFGWGNTWAAQTFTATASISVNTSALWGAVADVGNAMAAIRDLLPSSPAKKGPFAGPVPNLDYIADSFRASFDRMRSDAEVGIAGVRGALGGGRGGRGARSGDAGFVLNNPTINIHPADDDVQRAFTSAIVGDWR